MKFSLASAEFLRVNTSQSALILAFIKLERSSSWVNSEFSRTDGCKNG